MKAVRIIIAIGFVAALVYYYFKPLPGFIDQIGATLLPPSKEEKEVLGVFARYTGLLTRGDPVSEGVYMPNARFLVTEAGPHGRPHRRELGAMQHRMIMAEVLAGIRGGQVHVRFADIRCRMLPSGKVRLFCRQLFDNDRTEHLSMIFVSTAPQRWAVAEETVQDL